MKRKLRKTHRRKIIHSRSTQRRRKLQVKKPTTARQYFSMAKEEQETWDSVAHVISRMRDRVSLPKASKEFGIAPTMVVKLGRPALRKRNGRYVATKTDRLLRVVIILTPDGKKEIATRDSHQASLIGGHWAAVQKYLQTGDSSALEKFRGKKIVVAKKRYLLLTDTDELIRLGSAGVLRFESMYAGGAQ
jgi:hypothetical protein